MSVAALFLFAVLVTVVVAQVPPTPEVPANSPSTFSISTAFCEIEPTDLGKPNLDGLLVFTRVNSTTIRIDAGFSGLDPNNAYNFHVHTFGVYSKDGMAAGPHFGNCNGTVCRPTAPAADQTNAGWMPNAPRNFQSDNASKFQTAFYDNLLSLNGYFSVIGRSVVLHNGTNHRIGFCVIGRGDSAAVEAAAPLVSESVLVPRRLTCNLVPTQDGIDSGERVTGSVLFDAADVDVGVSVSWAIDGFKPTVVHHFHIHQEGNIADPKAAMLTLGHFNGSCVDCRPGFPAKLQEVGQIGNGFDLVAGTTATFTGGFYDSLPQLRGLRSIVGRSIVVHGPGNNGMMRIAQCVLGIQIEKLWVPAAAPTLSPTGAPSDPPQVSVAVIGLVAGLAVAVAGANVWYFRYRRSQDALARENEYVTMEAQQ